MFIKKLKTKILLTTLASSLMISNANAVYPVFDSSNLAQATKSFAETVAQNAKQAQQWVEEKTKWAQDLAHYAKQIQAYKDQLIASTGIKDAINAYKSINELYGTLKNTYEETAKIVEDPTKAVKQIFGKEWDQYMKYDRCSKLSGDEANSCYASFASMVGDLGTQNKAKELYKEKNEKALKELSTKVKESEDIKESADINNAIMLEMYQLMLHEADKRATEKALDDKEKLEREASWQQNLKEMKDAKIDPSNISKSQLLEVK